MSGRWVSSVSGKVRAAFLHLSWLQAPGGVRIPTPGIYLGANPSKHWWKMEKRVREGRRPYEKCIILTMWNPGL